MEYIFRYDTAVSGRYFIPRKQDLGKFADILGRGLNPVLYEAHGTGKSSLVKQHLHLLREKGVKTKVIELSLVPFRSSSEFLQYLVRETERQFSSPESSGLLRFAESDEDIISALSLPYSLAAQTGIRTFVILDQFQNLMMTDNGRRVIKIMKEVFNAQSTGNEQLCSYILCGSEVNAMKEIFENHRYLSRYTERCRLEPIDINEIVDYIIKGFTAGGKVVDRDSLSRAIQPFGGNLNYLIHFAANCDYLSRGYIIESVMIEAYEMVLSTRKASYMHLLNNLTDFQLNLIRAFLNGNTKFSTSEVIRQYNLNSSANVFRIKEALCKKEILTFNPNDEAMILDPLFEHWLRITLK